MALMAMPAATVDPAAALGRVRERTTPSPGRIVLLRGGWRRPALGGLIAATVAAALVATMAFTPLAGNLVKIFQPSQVTPVTINQGDLTGLDAFSKWGDVKGTSQGQLEQAESAAEAAKIAGLPAIKGDSGKLGSEEGRVGKE